MKTISISMTLFMINIFFISAISQAQSFSGEDIPTNPESLNMQEHIEEGHKKEIEKQRAKKTQKSGFMS